MAWKCIRSIEKRNVQKNYVKEPVKRKPEFPE